MKESTVGDVPENKYCSEKTTLWTTDGFILMELGAFTTTIILGYISLYIYKKIDKKGIDKKSFLASTSRYYFTASNVNYLLTTNVSK